jgi:hypothetical protein
VVPTLLSDGKLQLVSHAVDTVQANAQARAEVELAFVRAWSS